MPTPPTGHYGTMWGAFPNHAPFRTEPYEGYPPMNTAQGMYPHNMGHPYQPLPYRPWAPYWGQTPNMQPIMSWIEEMEVDDADSTPPQLREKKNKKKKEKEKTKDKGKKKAMERELIAQECKELNRDKKEVQQMLERLQNKGAALEHKEEISPDILFSIETLFTRIDNLKQERGHLQMANEALKMRNHCLEIEIQCMKTK
ncbi:hypothetical protein BDQ17DRAFT_1327393 [Cyathus striatus]|nr:hypothetical protein BDQ17DRAFT_1327393 [Cyathus striatus]